MHDTDRMNATRGYFYTNPHEAAKGLNLPMHWAICSDCHGEGGRALHGLVLNEDQTGDSEFMEDYMAGKYDSSCSDCDGTGKVHVVNEERCTTEQLKEYHADIKQINRDNAESLAEMRMGC